MLLTTGILHVPSKCAHTAQVHIWWLLKLVIRPTCLLHAPLPDQRVPRTTEITWFHNDSSPMNSPKN